MKLLFFFVDEFDVIVIVEFCIILVFLVDLNVVDFLIWILLVDSNLMIFGVFFLIFLCCFLKFCDIVCFVIGDGLLLLVWLVLLLLLLIVGIIMLFIKFLWVIIFLGIWGILMVRFLFEVGNNVSLNF